MHSSTYGIEHLGFFSCLKIATFCQWSFIVIETYWEFNLEWIDRMINESSHLMFGDNSNQQWNLIGLQCTIENLIDCTLINHLDVLTRLKWHILMYNHTFSQDTDIYNVNHTINHRERVKKWKNQFSIRWRRRQKRR